MSQNHASKIAHILNVIMSEDRRQRHKKIKFCFQRRRKKPKTNFYLFNCQYFEKDFNYDKILELPTSNIPMQMGPTGGINIDKIENFNIDPTKIKNTCQIGIDGMKIDREMLRKIKDESKMTKK